MSKNKVEIEIIQNNIDLLKINQEIINELRNYKLHGDLSDLGDIIGRVIAKYFDEMNSVDDFIMGLKHGISVIDGTH